MGAGFALALNTIREPDPVAAEPSPSPELTAAATQASATATPATTPSPVPSPSVSESPRPTSTPTPLITPSASHEPTPSPEDLSGRLTGSWEALPPPPDSWDRPLVAAVATNDGRIALMFYGSEDGEGRIGVYSPETRSWTMARVTGPRHWQGFGHERFVTGPDGRHYGTASVVEELSDGSWRVEWAPWRHEDYPLSIGITPDGSVYTVRHPCPARNHTIFEVSRETGGYEEVSPAPLDDHGADVIAGPPSDVLFIGFDRKNREGPLASYDTRTGEWTIHQTAPFYAGWEGASLADGWLWVPRVNGPVHEGYARDPETGAWLLVDLPTARAWGDFLSVDGRVYMIGGRDSYVFTPDPRD